MIKIITPPIGSNNDSKNVHDPRPLQNPRVQGHEYDHTGLSIQKENECSRKRPWVFIKLGVYKVLRSVQSKSFSSFEQFARATHRAVNISLPPNVPSTSIHRRTIRRNSHTMDQFLLKEISIQVHQLQYKFLLDSKQPN